MYEALSFSPELQALFFGSNQDTGEVIARQDPRGTVTVKNNRIVIEVRPFPVDDPSLSFTVTTDAGLNPKFGVEESFGRECEPPLPRVTPQMYCIGSRSRPHTLGWADWQWPRPARSSTPLFVFHLHLLMWKLPEGGLCVKFECKHDKDGHHVTDTFLALHPPPPRKRDDKLEKIQKELEKSQKNASTLSRERDDFQDKLGISQSQLRKKKRELEKLQNELEKLQKKRKPADREAKRAAPTDVAAAAPKKQKLADREAKRAAPTDIAAAPKKQKLAGREAKRAATIQTGIINAADLAADGTYTGSDITLKGGSGLGGCSARKADGALFAIKRGQKLIKCNRRVTRPSSTGNLDEKMKSLSVYAPDRIRVHYATQKTVVPNECACGACGSFEFVDCPACQCDGSDYDEVKNRPCSIM